MSTERDLKETLLDKGKDVLLAVIEQAKDGATRHPNAHPASQIKVWDALMPILQRVSEREKIVAQSNADVIELLKKGAVNIAEAKELVALLTLMNNTLGDEEKDAAETKKIIIEIATGGAR